MVRRANKKTKGRPTKQNRKIILIATEGMNKTEITYFTEFNRKQSVWHIVPADGNSTDPVKIVQDAIRTVNNRGIRYDYGDKVFAVFDTDFNKDKQIVEARKIAKENGIELILSNPCFEVWLLQHFRFSTRGYHSNEDVINELMNLWPEYRKSVGSFHSVSDRIEIAVKNARKLSEYHNTVNSRTETEKRNPSTDVYKLVEIICMKDNNN